MGKFIVYPVLWAFALGTGCGSSPGRRHFAASSDGRSASKTDGDGASGGPVSDQTQDPSTSSGGESKAGNGQPGAIATGTKADVPRPTTISTIPITISGEPVPSMAPKPACMPKGGPLAGISLVFDQAKGGPLIINGDGVDNVIDVSGGGGPGIVRVITTDATQAMIVPCVTDLTVNGNAGNDTLKVGNGFPGIRNITIVGGAGSNNITLYGNITAAGSITVN